MSAASSVSVAKRPELGPSTLLSSGALTSPLVEFSSLAAEELGLAKPYFQMFKPAKTTTQQARVEAMNRHVVIDLFELPPEEEAL